MMFNLFRRGRQASGENIIPLDQAKATIEAEIKRRGWEMYGRLEYALKRKEGREIWHCYGFPPHIRGPGMEIDIDAKSGEVVHAAAGDRMTRR